MDDEEYESNTIGGWVTETYGQIPPIGETVRMNNIEIKIVKATKKKVLKVRCKKLLEEAEDE